jgi:hypothetical protein
MACPNMISAPFKKRRLGDVDEGHQVHSLVLGLVQKLADPAFVFADVAQGFEVLEEATHHARYGSHGFQNDGAVAVAFGKKASAKRRMNLTMPRAIRSDKAIGRLVMVKRTGRMYRTCQVSFPD